MKVDESSDQKGWATRLFPFGDDPHDQEMIINGYNFSKQGCRE